MDRILQRFSNVIILTLIIIVRAPPSPFATCRETGWDETAANKKKVDEIVANQGATAVIIIYLLLLPHNLRLTPPPPPELSSILMDPEMQRVLQECALPGRMGKYMQDGKWGPKIRMLIDNGLLKVEK